jgi:hypothetical protein
MADYYTFRKWSVTAHGHEMVVAGKPGVWSWDTLNPGTAALLEVADVGPGDDVLDLQQRLSLKRPRSLDPGKVCDIITVRERPTVVRTQ